MSPSSGRGVLVIVVHQFSPQWNVVLVWVVVATPLVPLRELCSRFTRGRRWGSQVLTVTALRLFSLFCCCLVCCRCCGTPPGTAAGTAPSRASRSRSWRSSFRASSINSVRCARDR